MLLNSFKLGCDVVLFIFKMVIWQLIIIHWEWGNQHTQTGIG